MYKQITLQVSDKIQLTERIIEYFTLSGFKFIETNEDNLKFIHNSSIFDTWRANPLKWGSEILVSFNQNQVTANFSIDTDSQMNSAEEEKVWTTFIINFKIFLTDIIEFKEINTKIITDVKRSKLIYIGWTVLGALVGGLIGVLFSNLTGSITLGYLTIPIVATLFLRKSIKFRKEKSPITFG